MVGGSCCRALTCTELHARSPRGPNSHCRQLRRLRAARAALPGVRATLPRRTHGLRGLQAAGRLGLDLCPQCRRCPRSPAVAARSPRGAGLLRAAPAWSPRGLSHSCRVQAAGARSCTAARSPELPLTTAGCPSGDGGETAPAQGCNSQCSVGGARSTAGPTGGRPLISSFLNGWLCRCVSLSGRSASTSMLQDWG